MAMYEPVTVANNHNQWNGLHACQLESWTRLTSKRQTLFGWIGVLLKISIAIRKKEIVAHAKFRNDNQRRIILWMD